MAVRRSYILAAFILRGIRSMQVFMEMHIAKRLPQRTLTACMGIEIVKILLKKRLQSLTAFHFYIDEDAVDA
eukprot:704979-Amphidinium_carterae.1